MITFQVFDANNDTNTVVRNLFVPPFMARWVKIYPIKHFGAAVLRVELYKCVQGINNFLHLYLSYRRPSSQTRTVVDKR
jgi:hypothetical protein